MGGAIKKKSKTGARMVQLTLAVAALLPIADAAQAQLSAHCAQNLQFDSFAGCGGGGSIKVTPGGAVTTGGCVVMLGTPKQGKCTVQSFATSGSLKIQVMTPTGSIKGPGTMTLSQFNIATAGGGATKTYTSAMLTGTPLKFGIGGLLSVDAGEAEGAYTGKVIIKVFFTP